MSNYYIIITNSLDYEYDVKNNFKCAGFPSRNKRGVLAMQPGDKIVFYVSKISKFMAITEVTGKYFYSDEQYWSDDFDIYPDRIPIKPLLHIDDLKNGVYIKDIWDNLSFIKNKNKWGSQLMGSFRYLSEDDFKVIEKALQARLK